MFFEWDDNKDDANIEKHGIGFDFAILVWYDQDKLVRRAKPVAGDHPRYMAIGRVSGGYWTVIFTMPDPDTRRIISARPATRQERSRYDQNLNGR